MPLKITRDDGTTPNPDDEPTPVMELTPGSNEPGMKSEESSFLASMRSLFAEARAELETGDVLDEGPAPSGGGEVV